MIPILLATSNASQSGASRTYAFFLPSGLKQKEDVVLVQNLAYLLSQQCHNLEIDQSVNSVKGLSTEVSGIGSGVVIMNVRGT